MNWSSPLPRTQGSSGIDLGASEAPIKEELPSADADGADLATEKFELLAAPRGAPDDLAKLPGVGPQLVKKLNDAGVYHYWQLSAMTPDEAAKLDADLKLNGRIGRDNWIEQARNLIAG